MRPDFFLRQGFEALTREIVQLQRPMARQAVETMQREVLIKTLQAKEPLQRRLLHLAHVGKTHVIADERQNLLCLMIGESQTAADFLSDTNARLYVAVEAYAVGRHAKRGWFSDVVE